MASQQPTVETLLATADTYFQIFTSLDPAAALAITSENYSHTMAPASLGITNTDTNEKENKPPMDQAHFASHLAGLRGVLQSFPVIARETWPNPTLRQVVVWADARPEWHAHVKDGSGGDGNGKEWEEFRGEYIFVLFMDETGEKVQRCVEFLDSRATGTLMGLMRRALRRKAEVEGERPGDGVLGLAG